MLASVIALLMVTGASQEGASVEGFFGDFAERRNAVHSLHADFAQTTTTPDEVIESVGTLVYTSPRRLIFRYDDPPLVYMIDGLNAYEYDPDLEQLQIFALEDRPESEAFYLGFENNADRLQEAYDVRIVPPQDAAAHALGLEFTPKESEEEPYFQRVLLQLRKNDFLPAAILIVNDEESDVTFSITNFEVNTDLATDETHVVVPEGTVIVDNDTYAGEAGPDGMRVPAEAPDPMVEDTDLP